MTERARIRTYRLVAPEVWSQIRAEYAQGETARVLSERHGPSHNTIYARARDEGWTKTRQRDDGPSPAEGEPDIGPTRGADLTPREAAAAAAARAAGEMARGRPAAAAEFARLAETLARVADRLEPGAGQADGPELEPDVDALSLLRARIEELRRERAAGESEAGDPVDPVA